MVIKILDEIIFLVFLGHKSSGLITWEFTWGGLGGGTGSVNCLPPSPYQPTNLPPNKSD
ncbi:hypothetical protein BgiBS90_004786, partial [Biomphalaria glabrata]